MKIAITNLEFLHPTLREVLLWLEAKTSEQPTITSLYRIDDPGVHGTLPVRGADIRCRDKKLGNWLVELIDSKWEYDHRRPIKKVAILHGYGYNNHIHIQVHPNTIQRPKPLD